MSTPSVEGTSLGEQWIPVPVRLIRAVETAPNVMRRASAIAYIIIWMLAYVRTERRDPASLRDLRLWSNSNSQSRAREAKADAINALRTWSQTGFSTKPVQSQTESSTNSDHFQTNGIEEQPDESPGSRPLPDQSQTETGTEPDHSQSDCARLPSQITNTITDTNTKGSLSGLWAELETIRKKATGSKRSWDLLPARRSALKARVKETSEEDVKLVWNWWMVSRHTRASFLREKKVKSDTILRASNFSAYLEMAQEDDEQSEAPGPSDQQQQDDAWATWEVEHNRGN